MKIELKNLKFCYHKNLPEVLNNVNFLFESGKIYALSGKNGSGKTTLSKLIVGLLKTKKGHIFVDNVDIYKQNSGVISQKIGYLFQISSLQLFAPTVIEEMTFLYQLNNTLTDEIKYQIKKTLSDVQLSGYEKRFPLSLSGGEKQRLALATILIRNVDFLILDEPTSAIDIEGKLFLSNLINSFAKKGGGVLVITHDIDFVNTLENPIKIKIEGGILV